MTTHPSNDASLQEMNVTNLTALKLKERKLFRGHTDKITALAWSGDSSRLLTASMDNSLIIWDSMSANKLYTIKMPSRYILCCGYSQSGNLVASGGLDNMCTVFKMDSVEQLEQESVPVHRTFCGHEGYLTSCQFLNDRNVLTSSGDHSCILWDIEMDYIICKFIGHEMDCMAVSIAPLDQKNLFVSAGCDNTARLWDIRTGKSVASFTGHSSDVNTVKFFPNGSSFVTGSDDQTCRLYDIRVERESLMVYHNPKVTESVNSVSFSKSGSVLFSASGFHVFAWDLLTGKIVQTISGHDSRVTSLQVSPNGLALVTGSWDYTAKLFA